MRTELEILEMKLKARDLEIETLKEWVKKHEDNAVSLFERIKFLEKEPKELVSALKAAAVTCKEKNMIGSSDASYWLGAENAYLHTLELLIKNFNLIN